MSIGNKASVDELALLKYFADDPQTDVIAMYAEQLENAPELISLAKQLAQRKQPKPIIVLKSGRSDEGASASASHTGSLSGGDSAYQALFAQSGMIRANCIRELFDYAQILSRNKIAPANRVAVITNAGGPGVIATDEIVAHQLKMAKFTKKTVKKLQSFLPDAASTNNPIDVLGDARSDRYEKALQAVLKDDNTDAVIVILTPQSMTEIEPTAKIIANIKKEATKPIVASFMGQDTVQPGVDILRQANVTNVAFPEPAVCALAAFSHFSSWSQTTTASTLKFADVDKQAVTTIFSQAKKQHQTTFPEAEAVNILRSYGFPVLESAIAHSADEAEEIAHKFGGKLAMKIVSPDILHKSDVGGVELNFSPQQAADRYVTMMKRVSINKPEANLEGALIMQMAPADGVEVILGVNKHPGLGTLLMFGLGGIYVEVLKDVSFGFAPLTTNDARRMINSLQSSPIFDGVRGQFARDLEALVECLGRLSQLVQDFPQITELDINPLLSLAEGEGAVVLDARIVIK